MTATASAPSSLARLAVIAVPAIAAASQIRGVVVSILFRRAIEQMKAGAPYESLSDHLAFLERLGFWSHLAFVVLLLTASFLLATSVSRAKIWAWASVASGVTYLGMTAAERLLELGREIPLWVKAFWLLDTAFLQGTIVLAIAAAARQRDGARARGPETAAIAIGAASLAATAFFVFTLSSESSELTGWMMRVLSLVLVGAHVACAWVVSRSLDANASPPVHHGRLDGTPLRALGFALLARVILGILLQLAITTTARTSPAEAGGMAIAATGINGAISVVVLLALVAYLRYPTTHRSEALPAVIVVLVLSAALDAVAASATSSLLDGVAKAKAATSMWGSPSFSEMERDMETLGWCGGGALVFGVVAAVLLAGSLRRTAIAVDDHRSADRAGLVRLFVVLAGGASIALVVIVSNRSGASTVALAVVGLALVVFSLFLLVTWLQLLFGLARSVEAAHVETGGSDGSRVDARHGAEDPGALS